MQTVLTPSQQDRYSRQLMINDITETIQRSYLSSRVLVAGVGGLGTSAVQYLAAAGIGTIGIVDNGTVKRSNLQRQILYKTSDIGTDKTDAAARFITELNPDVTVEKHNTTLDPTTASDILNSYDIVVDGFDNFPGRFLVNDVTRLNGIPFVHGAVYGFEGAVTSFLPDGPCYRCLHPEAPDPDKIPSGEPIGVFPTIPGTIGSIQAAETLKILGDIGEPITNRVLYYDTFDGSYYSMALEQTPDCPICHPDGIESIHEISYTDRWAIE